MIRRPGMRSVRNWGMGIVGEGERRQCATGCSAAEKAGAGLPDQVVFAPAGS